MLTETIKKFVFITQADLSLEASTVFGVRAGHAADNLGMLKGVLIVFIVGKERTDRLNSV